MSLMQTKLSPTPTDTFPLPSCLDEVAVSRPLSALMRYAQSHNYEGWDPFDGLNSRLFKNTPLYRSELFRLALIQFCKRSPVNLRPLLMVPRDFNPKGGALFLLAQLNLYRHTGSEFHANHAYLLFQRLRRTQIKRPGGLAWGYHFDWQARAFYVPVGTPNLVTSVYAGKALLAYHRIFNDATALEMAVSVAGFILDEMILHEGGRHLCFRYIPGKDAEVHNANLLGAAYLAEVLNHLPAERQADAREKILKAARFSLSDLNSDASWPYGTKPFHRWVDNFHTAYNIECLLTIGECLRTDEFEAALARVVHYYLHYLFTDEGLPQYYDNRLYPIDIHVIAEAVVLSRRLRRSGLGFDVSRLSRIEEALLTLIDRFQDPQGHFYYQQGARGWNRIPYMRWGQAWMAYALSECLMPSIEPGKSLEESSKPGRIL